MFKTDTILIVEDDPNDLFFVRRAWERSKSSIVLREVRDGMEAMDYLVGEGFYADRAKYPMPDLILMDLKMPRKSGLEVLEWMKSTENICRIPVVIVTSSEIQKDIDRAYELGVNAYLIKPVDFEELFGLYNLLSDFFIRRACKPTVKESGVPA